MLHAAQAEADARRCRRATLQSVRTTQRLVYLKDHIFKILFILSYFSLTEFNVSIEMSGFFCSFSDLLAVFINNFLLIILIILTFKE